VANLDPTGAGAGVSAAMSGMASSAGSGMRSGGAMGGMGAMGGGGSGRSMKMASMSASSSPPPMGGGSGFAADPSDRWRQPGAVVPLGAVADVRVVTGPPMIKDENGVLVGYVFADIDPSARDLGGWVKDAKALVDRALVLPPGYQLEWTGQYEFMAQMEARMRYVLPLTLALIVVLLYLSLKGWPQTLLVLASLPFAVCGSVWLLSALDYNLSTAVWVGLIAVGGVAAQTGVVMLIYLDQAWTHAQESCRQKGRLPGAADLYGAVMEGAVERVRPKMMTVVAIMAGLLPIMWGTGTGSETMRRIAAPMVGGMVSAMVLTLVVIPVVFEWVRGWQLRKSAGGGPAGRRAANEPDETSS